MIRLKKWAFAPLEVNANLNPSSHVNAYNGPDCEQSSFRASEYPTEALGNPDDFHLGTDRHRRYVFDFKFWLCAGTKQ